MLSKSTHVTAIFLTALLAATVATPPRPASADAASTAAIAGLAGLVVGSLLFDSSRNQYYYSNGGHRRYVTNGQAQQYYQHNDPQYYNAHRSTFTRNHAQFANKWNQDHAGHGAMHGGNMGHDHH